MGQIIADMPLDLPHVNIFQHDVGGQEFFSTIAAFHHNHTIFHPFQSDDFALDFAKLHTEAANLHLGIFPSLHFDVAVRQKAAHVAGPVQAVAGDGGEFPMIQ